MKCQDCDAVINPETDRHVAVTERVIAPNLGLEDGEGRALCADCGDVGDARLAP